MSISVQRHCRQAFLAGLTLFAMSAAHARDYSVQFLKAPDGASFMPTGMNRHGTVVGTSSSHCVIAKNGVTREIRLTQAYTDCYWAAIDDDGNLLLTVYANGTTSVIRKHGHSVSTLAGLGGGRDWGWAAAGKGGFYGGTSTHSDGQDQAFVFSESGAGLDLGALTGKPYSYVLGMNRLGHSVGFAADDGNFLHAKAFLYASGTLTWLGNLGGELWDYTSAHAVNEHGTVVGQSGQWAFIYKNGVMRKLFGDEMYTGNAASINNHDEVVGRLSMRAYYFARGPGVDLNTKLSPDQQIDITLEDARAINDRGQILTQFHNAATKVWGGALLTPLN